MRKRNLFFLLFCVFLLISITSCKKSTEPEETASQSDSGTTVDTSAENCSDHEDADDYTWSSSDVIPIVLDGSSITANTAGVTISGNKLTITSAGTYSLSGTLSDGQIIVNTEDQTIVRLILDGVNINCSTSAPIYVKNSKKTIIVLADNTENYLTDGSSYVLENATADEPNAALYCKSDLTIYGNGSLTVTGKYNDGIASVDGLIIKSGNVTVTSIDDGIRGKDYLVVKGGNISVNAKGNGLKSDNSEDATKGYISIEAGTLNVTSTGDAITATTDAIITDGTLVLTSGGGSGKTVSGTLSAKAIKGIVSVNIKGGTIIVSSADDAIHSNGYIIINGGTFTISSADDGIHADALIKINGGNLNITKSYEGIESPYITVNNGNISIVASNDGFNATTGSGGEKNDGSCLYLYGGNIYVNVSAGDGLDSNGNIVMTAGTVVVHGPKSQPEVGADYNGTFSISGGFLIFTGPNSGNMIEATSTSSSQYAVKATSGSTLSASTLFHIQDETGNELVTFQPVRNVYYLVFSSPNLKSGSTYSIYTGGTSTGTNTSGLYSSGTYSGGTFKKSFTISGKITNVSF